MAHPHNTGGQAATLVRSSASEKIPTIPLYAFYNPQVTVEQSGETVTGFELASGVVVSQMVRELVRAKPKRLPYKRIGTIQPLFFPLTKLLCEPFEAQERPVPTPEVFRRTVEKAIDTRFTNVGGLQFDQPEYRLAAPERQVLPIEMESEVETARLPTVLSAKRGDRNEVLPLYMERLLDKAEGRHIISAPVKRPKIILRSE